MKTKLEAGQSLPIQYRSAQFDRGSVDEEKRTVDLSISSDEPYDRWFGTEILDHRAECIDLARMNAGAPLLYNHDRNAHLGRIVGCTTDGKTLRIKAKFSRSKFAEEKFQDVLDGILRETSVGYTVNKFDVDEDEEIYTATKWTPMEGSLVTIPADYTVGVGRDAAETFPVEVTKIVLAGLPVNLHTSAIAMPDTPTPSGSPVIVKSEAEIRADITREFEAEQSRKEQITALSTRFNRWVTNEDRDSFLRATGRPVSEFQAMILEKQSRDPVEHVTPKPVSEGMKPKDMDQYSIVRAINGVIASTQGGKFDGLEREMSDEVAKRHDRTPNSLGFFVPQDVMTRTLFATGSFTAAGALVPTGSQGQSLIELYRNKMHVAAMGAQVLSGLHGTLAIPKQTGGATAYWLAEDATVSLTNQAVGQLTMTPHRLSAATGYSRQLLVQASPDIENFVRNDLMTVLAVEKDRAALLGSGAAGEPLGIYNTANIATTVDITATSSITYAEAVQFETNVAAGNADMGSLGYITSVYIRGTARVTAKFASTATPLWDMDVLGNHPARATNQLTATPSVIFGNWSDLIIADWASPEVIVDPYSLAAANQVRVIVTQLTDIGIRHLKSFCFGVV